MAVGFLDNADSSSASTLSYTISAGSDRLLVVGLTMEGDFTAGALTCTYGGQSMTKQVNIFQEFGSFDFETTFFTLDETGIAAASGTTIAFTNLTSERLIVARSFDGVNQTTPVPETDKNSTTASTPNPLDGYSIVAGDDSAVCAQSGLRANETATWTGVTERIEAFGTGPATVVTYADDLFASSQTVNPRCTWTAQSDTQAIAMEIAPVAAPGGLSIPVAMHSYRQLHQG